MPSGDIQDVPNATLNAAQASAQRLSSEYEHALHQHADYYSGLLEELGPLLRGGGTEDGGRAQIQALQLLSSESANLYAALESALALGDNALLLRLAQHLVVLEIRQSRSRAARGAYEAMLTYARRAGDPVLLAWTLWGFGETMAKLHDLEPALAACVEALASFQDFGTADGIARATLCKGIILDSLGRMDEAQELFAESLAAFKLLDDRSGMSASLRNTSASFIRSGRAEEGRSQILESLALLRSVGDIQGESAALMNLGIIEADRGNCEQANIHFERSLEIAAAINDRHSEAYVVGNLAIAAELQGDYERALHFAHLALEHSYETGSRDSEVHSLLNICQIMRKTGRLRDSLRYCQSSLRTAMEIPAPIHIAYSLQQAAHLLIAAGSWAMGTEAIFAADAEFLRLGILETDGSSICLPEFAVVDKAVLEGRLSAATYASARDAAQAASLEEQAAKVLLELPTLIERLPLHQVD